MNKTTKFAAVLAVLVAGAFSAHADFGFGNREEPALRPYKNVWRGIKAFTYNVVKSIDVGNRKFPGLGIVEAGRGIRYGTVEFLYGSYMGMAGSRPKPVKDYSWPNEFIDSDWLLRNGADLAGGAVFWAHGSFYDQVDQMGMVFTAQKVVDHSPVLSPREKALYLSEKPQYAAQRKYLGRRAPEQREDGDVNYLRRARRQRVTAPPMLPEAFGAPRLPAPPSVVMPRAVPPIVSGGGPLPAEPPALFRPTREPAITIVPVPEAETPPGATGMPLAPVPMPEMEDQGSPELGAAPEALVPMPEMQEPAP